MSFITFEIVLSEALPQVLAPAGGFTAASITLLIHCCHLCFSHTSGAHPFPGAAHPFECPGDRHLNCHGQKNSSSLLPYPSPSIVPVMQAITLENLESRSTPYCPPTSLHPISGASEMPVGCTSSPGAQCSFLVQDLPVTHISLLTARPL